MMFFSFILQVIGVVSLTTICIFLWIDNKELTKINSSLMSLKQAYETEFEQLRKSLERQHEQTRNRTYRAHTTSEF